MADDKTFLQKLIESTAGVPAPLLPFQIGKTAATELTLPQDNPFMASSQEELEAIANADPATVGVEAMEGARTEIDRRAEKQEETFLQQLVSEDTARQFVRGPFVAEAAVTQGLPAMVTNAVGVVTGNEGIQQTGAEMMERYGERVEDINQFAGVGDPKNPAESVAENAIGAFVPGGIGAKSGAFATDYFLDQLIREATDDPNAQYETAFDAMGIGETEAIHPLLATGVGVLGVGLGLNAAARLKANRNVVKPPKPVAIGDLDPSSSLDDVNSLTTTGDITKSHFYDDSSPIADILARAGYADPEKVRNTLILDSGSAATTKAREALRTGRLDTGGRSFSATVPAETLALGSYRLPPQQRAEVARYLNLGDQLDDAKLAHAAGDASAGTTIGRIQMELRRIETDTPIVKKFKTAYETSMRELRDFEEGVFFSAAKRQELDQTRPNYVPRQEQFVDPNAPLGARMLQASREAGMPVEDAFLRKRKIVATDVTDGRLDPFEMLMEYERRILTNAQHNHARITVVDALESTNRALIRPITPNDDLAKNANRLVDVWRDGKKTTYITDEYIARTLKFDPYVAKHPWVFGMRRMAEHGMVGPITGTFAATAAVRDALMAPVVNKASIAPSAGEILRAVPAKLYAQSLNEVSQSLRTGLLSESTTIPFSVWPAKSRAKLADAMARRYLDTIYHQAQAYGGIDASDLTSAVSLKKTPFDEVMRSIDNWTEHPGITNVVKRHGIGKVKAVTHLMKSLYDGTMDSVRMAAFKRMMDSGIDKEIAARMARDLVGDTSRSGRIFDADGRVIRGDVIDAAKSGPLGATAFVEGSTAKAASYVMEGSPFVNPMIRGNVKFIQALRDNPVSTSAKAWLYYGMPAMAVHAWNEMMGEEYNDYAFNQRSADRVALYQYIANPLEPDPRFGVELPLAHEMSLFSVPYSFALHQMTRGENKDDMSFASQQILTNWAENVWNVDAPIIAKAAGNLAGINAEGMLGMTDWREIYEDDIGHLPENVEQMFKTVFGITGDVAVQLSAIMASDVDQEATWSDYSASIIDTYAERTPFVNNVTGRKTPMVSYSLPAQYNKRKAQAVEDVWKHFKEHLDDRYLTDMGLVKPDAKDDYNADKGQMGERDDLPFVNPGPPLLQPPTNPFFSNEVGDKNSFAQHMLLSAKRNEIGYTGLKDRIDKYSGYAADLRNYNAGHRSIIEEYQQKFDDVLAAYEKGKRPTSAEDEVELQAARFYKEKGLDITNWRDRLALISYIESEKSYVIARQNELFEELERSFTKDVKAQVAELEQRLGVPSGLDPEFVFNIEEHMDPYDANPLKLSKEFLAAMQLAPTQESGPDLSWMPEEMRQQIEGE